MARQEVLSDRGDGQDRKTGWQGQQHAGHRSRSSGRGRPAAPATPYDATGINPEKRKPIHPDSVYLPPP